MHFDILFGNQKTVRESPKQQTQTQFSARNELSAESVDTAKLMQLWGIETKPNYFKSAYAQ